MAINYFDTVTMYYECKIDLIPLFKNHWIHDTSNREKIFIITALKQNTVSSGISRICMCAGGYM